MGEEGWRAECGWQERGLGGLLIGTNVGHVECIDARTGRSLWIYVFPTMRHTMSYSTPYGMPPTMAERAEIFRRENRQPRTISGVQVLGRDGKDDSARVIFDPSPVDPFKRLPFYLTIAWTGAGMVVFGLLLSQLFMRVRAESQIIWRG